MCGVLVEQGSPPSAMPAAVKHDGADDDVSPPPPVTSSVMKSHEAEHESAISPKTGTRLSRGEDAEAETTTTTRQLDLDLGSSDEVKVFKDEDEVDGSVTESHQAELLAEKSSLITESEQVGQTQYEKHFLKLSTGTIAPAVKKNFLLN